MVGRCLERGCVKQACVTAATQHARTGESAPLGVRPGFSTVLAASFPLLANASVGRRGGMGMEPAYPEVLATHLCDNHGIRPVQVGKGILSDRAHTHHA